MNEKPKAEPISDADLDHMRVALQVCDKPETEDDAQAEMMINGVITRMENAEALVKHLKEVMGELCSTAHGEPSEWDSDKADSWSEKINAAFPTRSGSHEEYATAMQMVGNRYSKGSLVALVNWLLVELAIAAPAVRPSAQKFVKDDKGLIEKQPRKG